MSVRPDVHARPDVRPLSSSKKAVKADCSALCAPAITAVYSTIASLCLRLRAAFCLIHGGRSNVRASGRARTS